MLPLELASKLLVAVIRRFHEGLFDKRLASSANALFLLFYYPEKPEATRRHLVGAKALLCFKLLLHVFDASLCAIVLVVGAMVVEGVPTKVCGPGVSIVSKVLLVCVFSIRTHNGTHLAALKS